MAVDHEEIILRFTRRGAAMAWTSLPRLLSRGLPNEDHPDLWSEDTWEAVWARYHWVHHWNYHGGNYERPPTGSPLSNEGTQVHTLPHPYNYPYQAAANQAGTF